MGWNLVPRQNGPHKSAVQTEQSLRLGAVAAPFLIPTVLAQHGNSFLPRICSEFNLVTMPSLLRCGAACVTAKIRPSVTTARSAFALGCSAT
jgi:hypothetical protein